ncbi:MAG: UDP-N-acetylmuramoyl-tripeptide--D-alanyl-D-alanine ligase, partial [Legionellaceae bacterium]
MTVDDIASVLELTGMTGPLVSGFSIDSRQVQPGQLFVAIKGPNFDGHDFILEAVAKGAIAVLCEHAVPNLAVPQGVVQDTVKALSQLATAHRKRLSSLRVIALTGSNGKTTVKEMIASLLPQPSFSTLGNLNNHLGVPLNVLKLTENHRSAVFELGANQAGDVAYTVAMVQPHVTLINNIAPAHIGGFGSIDGVARAKGEIHAGLLPGGTAVINADDAYAHAWDALLQDKQCLRFSVKTPEFIHARDIHLDDALGASFTLVTPEGEARVQLQVPGLHNVS